MLDARKLARVVENRTRLRQGRTRTVTLVYRRPEGTAYVATALVWRAQPYQEPVVTERPGQGQGQGQGQRATPVAVRAEFPLELDPRLVTLVADTPAATAEAVAAAARYEVLSYHPAGIVMNRWVVGLKRLR